ncbi:MAG: cupredoxin domain-containing protein [Acidimicrobiia bacterium]
MEVGDPVTWVWDDDSVEHNVVGEDFASAIMSDGTFTETFEEPGSYSYVCTIHPGMDGTITVTEG